MFQKAMDIVKARWPEVMLVVVLQAAIMLLLEKVTAMGQMPEAGAAMVPFWASFLLGVGAMLFAILWQMIYLGFLKTAAVSGEYPQQPMQLLQWGRPYFWRIFFFQILLGLALFVLNSILISLLVSVFWRQGGLQQMPTWAAQVSGLAGALILLKPLLLVPAVILVYDKGVFAAFSRIWRLPLFGIDSLLKVIIAGFGLILATVLLIELAQLQTPVYHVLTALHHGVFSLVFLLLSLMAVLWVQQRYEAEYVEYAETNEVDE